MQDHLIQKHPDNLFFSDSVKLYINNYSKPGILIIYQGTVYFICSSVNNLKSKKLNLDKSLLLKPFQILDDVSKVILPF